MLWESGDKWLEEAYGVTNYRTLLDEINRFRKPDESVSLVTFNYDMLLEPGLEDLGFKIRDVSDYVEQHPFYKVFKVHGSVNWGRVVGSAGLEHLRHDRYPQPTINRMIELGEKLQVTGSYVLAKNYPMAWLDNQPIFPAIAIPVQTKSNFECPPGHLDQLKKLLPSIDRILIVGWRATEQHFLTLLTDHLPERIIVHIVAGSNQYAQSTAGALQPVLSTRKVELSLDTGGFTDFILEKRAQKFLGIACK